MSASRFWTRVQKTDSCWLWLGNLNDLGYGRVRVQGRLRQAHRVSYELVVGPIPLRAYVTHLCPHRACVNPRHLKLRFLAE